MLRCACALGKRVHKTKSQMSLQVDSILDELRQLIDLAQRAADAAGTQPSTSDLDTVRLQPCASAWSSKGHHLLCEHAGVVANCTCALSIYISKPALSLAC